MSESMSMSKYQEIMVDGSYGEGGGRVFRDSVMYATIAVLDGWRGTLTINNIRSTRPKPGIKNSLLGIVGFCKQVLDGVETVGIIDGSLTAYFNFRNARQSLQTSINIDINGVGSAWLLFLAVHPVLLHPLTNHVHTVTIHGGTDVYFPKKKNTLTLTPPTIYMRDVWQPNVNKLVSQGFYVDVNIIRNQKDKGKYPYAIKIQRPEIELESSSMEIQGLKVTDGVISTVQSVRSGLVVGTSHPYNKFVLAEPDPELLCDEHFSDMVIPYLKKDDPMLDQTSTEFKNGSAHYRSAVYVRSLFT